MVFMPFMTVETVMKVSLLGLKVQKRRDKYTAIYGKSILNFRRKVFM